MLGNGVYYIFDCVDLYLFHCSFENWLAHHNVHFQQVANGDKDLHFLRWIRNIWLSIMLPWLDKSFGHHDAHGNLRKPKAVAVSSNSLGQFDHLLEVEVYLLFIWLSPEA